MAYRLIKMRLKTLRIDILWGFLAFFCHFVIFFAKNNVLLCAERKI